DRFTVSRFAAGSHRVDEQYSGIHPRLFHSIIQRVQQRSAWELSTASLHRDIEMACRRARAAYDVMDSSHFYLDIRSGTHRLQADCYAPQAYSQFFPEIRSLQTFAQLTNAI